MSQIESIPESAAIQVLRPLCVDLDGTLVKSDTLEDSLLALARRHPERLLALPERLLHGKAAFKEFVTKSIALDVTHLPYNHKVLRYLEQQHRLGREIYLATGANVELARRVAIHLGFFSGVFGSNGDTNLTGNTKLEGLRASLKQQEFDYIGNSVTDLPLLAHATEPMVANPSLALKIKMKARGIHPAIEFQDRRSQLHSLIGAIRPHQWAKNLLVFLPVLLAHSLNGNSLLKALLAFVCFSLTASATYIANDLLDIEADRYHSKKRRRPFASGNLSPIDGFALSVIFLAVAFAGARLLPLSYVGWLLLYATSTFAYSTFLKRIPLVDVLILSGLYTLRLLAGSAATGFPISHWLGGFSVFLFFSLAIAKRFTELEKLRASGAVPRNGRGYVLSDFEQLRTFGTSSAFAAVVIFVIYISGNEVMALYRKPALLWLMMPLMILWLCRVWLLASRGKLNEDPVVFALTDAMSLLIGVAVLAIALLAI